ncbi:Holliday junction branch migration protein RuvA [Chromatocurvus halotolerans]|uniref:Holliday junction branch migration complex subunit RuvA n=1 Tax=Chromatocurvus halotolerans TaxID=1132028 RepID=A0A4R2L3Z2_9GAMM|nr:Holliday junction branch migration protein RuvA [Chromatocurvus halotolerans]TCO77298.1 Holliday junction DNA helicase subunit RuvA [Chromatocurvus halotolerans]
MIGRLRGVLVTRQPPEIVVDVAGVGYEVQVPMSTFFKLPAVGEEVSLVTHFVVREDAQLLYGFLDERDRVLFRSLIKVSGVGPKLALTLLSGMDADSFVRCVQREDLKALVATPGVGRKTAERLLVEMRDKLKDWIGVSDGGSGVQSAPPDRRDIAADAEGALVALGYKPAEAAKLVSAVKDDSITDSEELIRRALRSTVRDSSRSARSD